MCVHFFRFLLLFVANLLFSGQGTYIFHIKNIPKCKYLDNEYMLLSLPFKGDSLVIQEKKRKMQAMILLSVNSNNPNHSSIIIRWLNSMRKDEMKTKSIDGCNNKSGSLFYWLWCDYSSENVNSPAKQEEKKKQQ